jgi:hypothetical protein
MCHVDCISRRYCEDGLVYREGSGASPMFPCGTQPPPFSCSPRRLEEQCEHGCDEAGLACASEDVPANGGAGGDDGGQSGEAGASSAGEAGDGGRAS